MKPTSPFALIRSTQKRIRRLAAATLLLCLFAQTSLASSYYVNDGSLSNDLFCTAVGLDANDGLTPSTPVASLATILQRYTLTNSANTVFIDSGLYISVTNIVIGPQHAGSGDFPIAIQGAGRTTVLNRSSQNPGDCCLLNLANFVTFTNLTLTGGDVGLAIDASYCTRADISGNTFCDNGGAGLLVETSTNAAGGYFKIDHNLLFNNKNGLVLQPQTSAAGSTFQVFNNTVSVTNGSAIVIGGNIAYSSLRNNLLVAKGSSLCLEAISSYGLFQSDFNNLWTLGSGSACRVQLNGVATTFGSLAKWQRYTQASFNFARDAHSICREPFFASPANGDFHLMSSSGRWLPQTGSPTGGVWVTDGEWHSPAIDAADPYSFPDLLANEPEPNGGRLNIGAYGGTAEASKTAPGRRLLALVPDLGQKTGEVQVVYWNASGLGWTSNEVLQLKFSLDSGSTWQPIDTCTFSASGTYNWQRPAETFGAPNGCWVSVTCDADTNVTDAAFLESYTAPTPTVFYVNDSSLADDIWCVAPGNDAYDGLQPHTPMASVQSVINRYHPGVGATIYVDAGTYMLYEDLQLPDTGAGGGPSNNWFRLIGAERRTLLKRQYGYAGSCCIRVRQDFTRIEGVTCQGGETGILIDPSSCRNATLANNTVTENTGYGIRVLTDPNNNGFDTYEIKNNLLFNNGGGLNLQSGQGCHLAFFTVQNNTIATYNGTGIACGGRGQGTVLRNNIISAKGAGFCLSVDEAGSLSSSDYNDLYAYSGASAARLATNNAYTAFASLTDWQSASGADASSISRDPLFVSPVGGDYHLRSTGGSWHDGAWLADTATSPCIDAGNPAADFGSEPPPNGGRINMGAFGGTREASRSALNRILVLLNPRGGETLSNALTVAWNAFGSGWQSNDSVRIEFATATNNWTVLSAASSLSPTGSFTWQLPNPTTASLSYYLRVVCNQNPLVYDATKSPFTVLRRSARYYVNDANTNGDWYCSAPGADNNTGASPNQPIASLAELLKKVRLGPGDTVFVDTGYYALSSNIVIDASHKGAPDAFIRIVGTCGGSVLSRTALGSDRKCLEAHADFIRIEGLTCEGALTAISVNASSARHAHLVGNTVRNNQNFGIAIKPFSGFYGEEYQLLQNVVINNGFGVSLEGATNRLDNRCLFLVENNTIVNGGIGVKLLNSNAVGKRTNLLKNNIIETTNAQAACILALPGTIHYSDFNNLRSRTNGFAGAWLTGPASQIGFFSLAEWRSACGQEAHSTALDPSFVSPLSGNFRLKMNSPCIDAGINSFWMFDATDADGKPRITGKGVDMGAYELFVRTSVRLFLQGPFRSDVGQMTSLLSDAGLIPAQAPYAEDPRTASLIPTNVTDWVLVQFRNASNGPALFSRSVFLRKDGWLVNDAGSPNLDVDLQANQAFYLVVKHRNHLPAMSAAPLVFTNQLFTYDFTMNPQAFFGGSVACVSVTGTNGTCWALGAGDTDGDGAVLPVDLSIFNSLTNSVPAYRRSDANLDGSLTTLDNSRIAANLGFATPVPRPETILQPALWISPSRKTLAQGESVTLSGGSFASDATASGSGSGGLSAAESLTWDFVFNRSLSSLLPVDTSQRLYCAGTLTGRTDVVEAWNSSEHLGRAFFNVVGEQAAATAGKALIIAGRVSSGDTLWPTTDYLADNAYTTLRYRGFTKENIHYLSPEPGQDVDGDGNLDDIDGESTFAQAAYAFTNVVATADRLFVYLVDHGGNSSGNGYFRLNASETITAAQLDTWLDDLQDRTGAPVTVVLDFCYAGSFLNALTYHGLATRIVIAACDADQPSYFVAGGLVSFSGAFFTGVMLGYDILQCFNSARSAMSSYQGALLDDDKDGTYTANDGALASGTYIGPTSVAAGDVPQIGEVCGNQVLTEETSASLWIGSVSSLYPISRAWCLIVPPGFNPDPETPVTDLPELDLSYDAASGRYSVTFEGFTSPGTYNVMFYVQDEEGNVSSPRTAYIAQIGYDDRVILVAGSDTNSASWPAVDYLTRLAYSTLRLRLFTPDHIRVLSPGPATDFDGNGTNDIAGAASLTNLFSAINQWALTQSTDRLTVYLLGDGATNTFCLSRTECLTTNQLATWIHNYQVTNPIPVNILLDFSGAGAFLPSLADPQLATDAPDATRIAIASAREGREALFTNGGTVSFSQYLFSGLVWGETLGEAYTAARRAIRRVSGSTRQQAQIDDNLNGEPNEKDLDGLHADVTYLGSAFVTGADAPLIGAVVPPSVLYTPGTPVTLWASDVTGMNPVSNIWCTVTPPGFDDTGDLPTLDLVWNATAGRYEVTCADFTQPGAYGLTFYAQDSAGQISDPRQSEIILADAYENDDGLAGASLYDGTPQIHTFHTSSDADWVRLYLVTNFIYDIETYPLSERLDTVIDFYREESDGSLTLLDHVDEEGGDEGEYTGIDYPTTGWYWTRLSPYSEGTNTLGSYEFSVSIPAAGGLNSLIVLGLDDVYSCALPTGATVTVTGQGTKSFSGSTSVVYSSLTNGTYLVTVPMPTNFIAREDPSVSGQVQSLTNIYYANPRRVAVDGGWKMAGFELLSTVAVTSGIVRDAWTRAYLNGAQLAFTAASGSLTGTVVNGSVILTSYCTNWLSANGGKLPSTLVLGACNWNLSVSLAGYQTYARPGAISNVQAGAKVNLGTTYLVPADTNANQVADSWEATYFKSGMNPNADSDGDGLDNRSEYLCGTDPTNALSVLRFLSVQTGPVTANLSWAVSGGRSYHVLAATSLVNGASSATNGPWEAAYGQSEMLWSDTNVPLKKTRFYRVRLNAP